MNAILWPVFEYVAKNKWLQIVLAILTGWIFIMIYLHFRDSGVRERERARQEAETVKERERVLATSREVINDIQDAKDAAIAAPDTVPFVRDADELRVKAPAVSKVILRDRP